MKKILGVIVSFNPDIHLLNINIVSFSNYVDKIVIIDNNSNNINDILKLENYKIKVICNKTNLGIAKALNVGLNMAYEANFDYLLTMDQDSYFSDNSFPILLNGFNHNNVAIVSPSLKDANSNNIESVNENFENVFTTITSGSLCLVSALNSIGGFKNQLFIDYVDVEICLRLQIKKYNILRSKNCFLHHQLGDSKAYKLFGIKFISTNHSPFRRYYYARNKIYVYKNYLFNFPLYVCRDFFSFLKTIAIIFIYENEKRRKLKMILKGIIDGVFKI